MGYLKERLIHKFPRLLLEFAGKKHNFKMGEKNHQLITFQLAAYLLEQKYMSLLLESQIKDALKN